MHGKCPKCEKVLHRVTVGEIDAGVPFGKTWRGITYSCPFCHAIISVQIDPIAIKTEIVDEIFKKLRS